MAVPSSWTMGEAINPPAPSTRRGGKERRFRFSPGSHSPGELGSLASGVLSTPLQRASTAAAGALFGRKPVP